MNHSPEPCPTLSHRLPSAPGQTIEKDRALTGPYRIIGPYRIEETLGVGGMGTVYRAFDQRLQRPVALKHIHPETKRDPSLHQRLLREARTAAQLCHPNIVQVYDILEQETGDWIVMELVDGGTLLQLLYAEKLDVPRVISLAIDITQGLTAAHALGIVHRDLKAENIIVTPADQAKILDFGVAKLQGLQETLSKAGQVLGTPRAMSPEQASGKPIDHRSDLFSLGVLLYETLTCRSPFRSKTSVAETLDRICALRQRPAHQIDRQIPPELSNLVDWLLEKDADHRPQSAEEVTQALRRLVGTPTGPQKILFVDDEPELELLVRQKYRQHTQAGEIDLLFARDGAEAWRILTGDDEISMVISDIHMPNMDGLALLKKIQTLDRYLVTIIISSFDDIRNLRTAMNLGAFDFLSKPIDFEDLELTRKKAQAAILRNQERRKLRQENRFLHEHIDFLRDIFNRNMQNDSTIRELVGCLASGKREVTVLKAKIRNYRQLPENLSPADLQRTLSKLFSSLPRIVGDHQGTMHDFDHGRITVVFGLPLPRTNDVQRAVDCAIALRQSTTEISQLSRRGGGPPLTLEVSVESGNIVFPPPSGNQPGHDLATPLVVRSSLIEAQGTEGAISISETTVHEIQCA